MQHENLTTNIYEREFCISLNTTRKQEEQLLSIDLYRSEGRGAGGDGMGYREVCVTLLQM